MKKFILIDANSLIHRAFHALPPLLTKDGVLVNAVYGFATIFLKALKDFEPDYVACCFDVSKDTFRRQEYEQYKANRPEQPSELYEQMDLIKQLLEAFNIMVYEKKGFEADDVIGTISRILDKKKDIKTFIVSGDLDVLQLINDNTEVYTLKRGISDTVIYDVKAVKERYGFGPEQVVDYKALRGDPSDNIPGVKGIGEKIAMELIKDFGSLDKIYEYVEKLALRQTQDKKIKKSENRNKKLETGNEKLNTKGEIKAGVLEKLKAQKKEAYLSQRLSQIHCEVPLEFKLEDCATRAFDTEHVVKLFQAWNFSSLIGKIPHAEKLMYEKQGTLFGESAAVASVSPAGSPAAMADKLKMKKGYVLIDNEENFADFIKELEKQEMFAVDTETDGLNPFENKLIGISFSWQETEGYYLAVDKKISPSPAFEELKKILENPAIKKIGHNIKFDFEVLETFGIKLAGLYFDTMIASYLLNPGTRQHNLEELAFVEFGYKMQPIEDLIGPGGRLKSQQCCLADVDKVAVANYSCEDADLTWRLYFRLSEKLDDAVIEGVLQKIEMPLVPVLAEMERSGIKIDRNFLKEMGDNLALRLKNLEGKIYKLAGEEFNVASPLQLKKILFEKLKISTAGIGKTKTGISTAAGELEKLKGRHEIIDLIMDFRELSKLKNTYLDPLPLLADKNGRVHTSFNQTITATGRLSSSDPNLQNIPIRTEIGREIRRAFVAEKGYKIISADYSQIELRIVASLAEDKKMLQAFRDNEDIHTATAAEIFELPLDKVTKDERRQAKAVNFGIVYGLGPRGLAQGTGISYEQAQEFIEKYFEIYSGIKEYIESTIALAHELGYVETLFGRRRYLPEINAHHPQLRAQAERMAVNHPVQGTSADLIKLAMISIQKRIDKEFVAGEARMLLQVHDELVFEVKNDLVESASKIIKEEMENVYKLRAPIKVEVSVGENWGEAK